MTEQQLIFDRLIHYDPGQDGVTVKVSLSLSAVSVNFAAKVDAGASYRIPRPQERVFEKIVIGIGQVAWLHAFGRMFD